MPSFTCTPIQTLKTIHLKDLLTEKWNWIKFAISFLVIPFGLMFLGMIIDRIVYDKTWVFHASCLLVMGICVAPFVFFRWIWHWKENELYWFNLVVYLAFFICFNIYLTMITSNTEGYYFTKSIRHRLLENEDFAFDEIASVDDIYDWLRGPVDEHLFPKLNKTASSTQFVIPQSTQLRLRQVRVHLQPATNPYLKGYNVIPKYSADVEMKEPYGPNNTWIWKSADYKNIAHRTVTPLARTSVTGVEYPKHGYMFDIDVYQYTQNHTWFDDFVSDLQANNWITAETKLVSLEILPFNPSAEIWGYACFDIELTRGGSVEPVHPMIIIGQIPDFGSDKNASKTGDHLTYYPLYGLVLSFVLFYICEEVLLIIQHRKKYLMRGHNYVQWLSIVMIILSWLFRIISDCYWPLAELPDHRVKGEYINVSSPATFWLTSRELIGVAAFLVYFNILRFLKIFPSLAILPRTFMQALGRVTGFFVSFIFCLMGFAMSFLVVFGDSLVAYQKPFQSLVTLWQAMLGDSDSSYLSVDPVFGYMLYILFTFITVFVLLTMMISIIGDAYNTIKERYHTSEEGKAKASQMRNYLFNSFMPSKNNQEVELESVRKTLVMDSPPQFNTNKMFNGGQEEDTATLLRKLIGSVDEIKKRIQTLEETPPPPPAWKTA